MSLYNNVIFEHFDRFRPFDQSCHFYTMCVMYVKGLVWSLGRKPNCNIDRPFFKFPVAPAQEYTDLENTVFSQSGNITELTNTILLLQLLLQQQLLRRRRCRSITFISEF